MALSKNHLLYTIYYCSYLTVSKLLSLVKGMMTQFLFIFRNDAAIKACISLATVGCDHMTFTTMYDYMVKETSMLSCDILPATPKNYKRPNMTFPFECLANLTGNQL